MCGQSSAYNTYATPQTLNPLFQGFSRYQNVNKIKYKEFKNLENRSFQGFLYTKEYRPRYII